VLIISLLFLPALGGLNQLSSPFLRPLKVAMSSPRTSDEPRVFGNPKENFWLLTSKGWDLTHPSTPDAAPIQPRMTLETTTASIIVDPKKTALIIIDMQNYFLSPALGRAKGPGHVAEDMLLRCGIPAARKAGIRVIHVTWGLDEDDLANLTPTVYRAFGVTVPFAPGPNDRLEKIEPGTGKESARELGIGDDMGKFKVDDDGSTVEAGRMLVRNTWNAAIHDRLLQSFEESQNSQLPDLQFHKNRISGFWGGSTPVLNWLKNNGIKTLFFAGVNTDQCVYNSLTDACNEGFDTVLLRDGCGTSSPDFAKQMAEWNCRKTFGFVSSCEELEKAGDAMTG